MEVKEIYEGLIKGQYRALSKAITLVESTLKEDQKKAEELLVLVEENAKSTLKIGVSGPPGVGKSTFIDRFGCYLLDHELVKNIGVLAIDPSSPVHGGSILGDKTRMTDLSQREETFIRPSPGGMGNHEITKKTAEVLRLFEAASFDCVFVETIGSGQSEYSIHDFIDVFILLQMPSSGDDLQSIKKGSLELADIKIIHKADGQLSQAAKKALLEHKSGGALSPYTSHIKTFMVSSKKREGFEPIWPCIKKIYANKLQSQQPQNNTLLLEKLKRFLGEQLIEHWQEQNPPSKDWTILQELILQQKNHLLNAQIKEKANSLLAALLK